MKRILVIVDMQNDFIFRDCALGTAEAEAAYGKLCNYLATTSADYDYIVFTRDTHYADYLDTAEGKKLPITHCIKNTTGWEIPERLYDLAKKHTACHSLLPTLVDKYTFGSINLPDVLADLTEDVGQKDMLVEFCGLCTDICVVSNVLMTKAHFPEAQIIVHEEFCAGVTPASHDAAIITMRACQIDVI